MGGHGTGLPLAIDRLTRAVEAFENGETLWAGECLVDVPEKLREVVRAEKDTEVG